MYIINLKGNLLVMKLWECRGLGWLQMGGFCLVVKLALGGSALV